MSSPTCNIQGWDERAKTYSERNDLLLKTPEQRQKWTKLLLFLLNLHMEADVLDVGTGPGFLALQLAKLGYRTTGVDLSTEMLRIAAEKAKSMKLNCMFIHADAETLPFT
ncbi:MAG: rRNA ((747)-C(5))-methyltransferase, partial [Paenibacillus sp.]|nr:rRNA ((747)-C(5))-methyltransferase [Paenibacillus sp.]